METSYYLSFGSFIGRMFHVTWVTKNSNTMSEPILKMDLEQICNRVFKRSHTIGLIEPLNKVCLSGYHLRIKSSTHVGLLAGAEEEEVSTRLRSAPGVFFGMKGMGSMETCFSPHSLMRKKIGASALPILVIADSASRKGVGQQRRLLDKARESC